VSIEKAMAEQEDEYSVPVENNRMATIFRYPLISYPVSEELLMRQEEAWPEHEPNLANWWLLLAGMMYVEQVQLFCCDWVE
jgi:hypothetical protein